MNWVDENTGLEWCLYDGRYDIDRTWGQEGPEDIGEGYHSPTREQVETIMDDDKVQHLDVWTCEEFGEYVGWACNFKESKIYKRDKSNAKHPLYVR